MADIAVVFGWQPDYMDGLGLEELMMWREEARVRNSPEEG